MVGGTASSLLCPGHQGSVLLNTEQAALDVGAGTQGQGHRDLKMGIWRRGHGQGWAWAGIHRDIGVGTQAQGEHKDVGVETQGWGCRDTGTGTGGDRGVALSDTTTHHGVM